MENKIDRTNDQPLQLQDTVAQKERETTAMIGKKIVWSIMMSSMILAHIQMAPIEMTTEPHRWTLLGTCTVDYTLDRDVVTVTERTLYTTLKFIVKNGTLHVHKCTVHFTDGDKKEVAFSNEVSKNNDGIMLDLKGSNRTIEKVTFWYNTKNSSGKKSVVELWGLN